jgi:hypothetical protein
MGAHGSKTACSAAGRNSKALYPRLELKVFWQQLAVAAFFIATLMHAASADELIQPPVCSPLKPIPRELKEICKIKKEDANHHKSRSI